MIIRQELNDASLETIKEIERDAYRTNPDLMAIAYCNDWCDVASYMDCGMDDIRLFLNDDSYLLIAEKEPYIEIVDLASRTARTNIKQIISVITGFQKPFLAYCRQMTSYPILLYMERKEKVVCFSDIEEVYGNETFHWVTGATKEVYERMTVSEMEELTDNLYHEEEEYEDE